MKLPLRLSALFAAAVLIAPPFFASPAGAAITQRSVPVKAAGSSVVYYVAPEGKRYVFPNRKTFDTWFPDLGGVLTVSADDLGSLPLSGNVTYRPGIRMVKVTTDPKVYAVDRGGTLRWIMSEAAATALYGADWNTKIDDVPDAFFADYRVGSAIGAASDFSVSAAVSNAASIEADKAFLAQVSQVLPFSPSPVPPAATPAGCTTDLWSCINWSACFSPGFRTRDCFLTNDCASDTTTVRPVTYEACTVPPSSGFIGIEAIDSAGPVVPGVEQFAGSDADASLATFRISAANEDLDLIKASFSIADPAAVTTLYLYDPGNRIGTSAISGGNAFFSGFHFLVPKNSTRDLAVMARLTPIGVSGVPTGPNARVTFETSGGQHLFEAVGVAGSETRITSIPNGSRPGKDKVVHKAYPTVASMAPLIGVLTAGDVVATRMSVTASSKGGIAVKALTFDIRKPNALAVAVTGGAAHSVMRRQGASENLAGHSTASAGCAAGGGTTCRIRTVLSDEEIVAASTTMIYEVRLNIGGTLTTGDTITTTISGDTQHVVGPLTAGSDTDQVRVNGTDVNFVWSDMTALPHVPTVGASSNDWVSGRHVPTLPATPRIL